MTKNSGDWEGLQGHDDDPAQFKHKAWVHEGGVAYIYNMYIYNMCIYIHIYTSIVKFGPQKTNYYGFRDLLPQC